MSPSRRLALTALALALVSVLTACMTQPPEGVKPVDGFDLERYLGTWHEIARLDHRFERGLVAVTAHYALRDDGGVAVTNRGWDTDSGEWTQSEGRAYFTGSSDRGSLKVSFFGPFYGGYHILALDEASPDYRYAVVAGPGLDYLWILSREPELPDSDYDRLLAMAAEAGFPVDDLILVPASPPDDA